MQSPSGTDTKVAMMAILINLDNLDAHCERARWADAKISQAPRGKNYDRSYTAHDVDSHPWLFTMPSSCIVTIG